MSVVLVMRVMQKGKLQQIDYIATAVLWHRVLAVHITAAAQTEKK
jgi:hypothetical protein